MGQENKCKIVPNTNIPGKVRMACSKCGSIIEDKNVKSCPHCHRLVKSSKFSAQLGK